MNQRLFSEIAWDGKGKTTRREKFLCEMESAVPWQDLEKIVEPHAPNEVPDELGGRPAYPVSVMLRIYFCQSWYQLSDEAAEDSLYDIESMRRFCLGTGSVDSVPDERSIRRFRHLLEEHKLPPILLRCVNRILSEQGIFTKQGTIVDATLFHAASTTKNKTKSRDPEMSSTKKNNKWHFGMKSHIGVDEKSGIVHTAVATTAKDADIGSLHALIHGQEKIVRGDSAYASEGDSEILADNNIELITPKKKPVGGELSERERERNKNLCSKRAKVEHPFHIVKCIFGYRKVRYRGLFKNFMHQTTLYLLSNLYLLRRRVLSSEIRWA